MASRLKLGRRMLQSPNPATRITSERLPDGRKNSGRRKGSVNRIGVVLKDAIILAAEDVGQLVTTGMSNGQLTYKPGPDGLRGYLRWLSMNHPKSFSSLLARVIPLHVVGEMEHTHKDVSSKQELIEELKARGLPVDQILSVGQFQHLLLEAQAVDVTPKKGDKDEAGE